MAEGTSSQQTSNTPRTENVSNDLVDLLKHEHLISSHLISSHLISSPGAKDITRWRKKRMLASPTPATPLRNHQSTHTHTRARAHLPHKHQSTWRKMHAFHRTPINGLRCTPRHTYPHAHSACLPNPNPNPHPHPPVKPASRESAARFVRARHSSKPERRPSRVKASPTALSHFFLSPPPHESSIAFRMSITPIPATPLPLPPRPPEPPFFVPPTFPPPPLLLLPARPLAPRDAGGFAAPPRTPPGPEPLPCAPPRPPLPATGRCACWVGISAAAASLFRCSVRPSWSPELLLLSLLSVLDAAEAVADVLRPEATWWFRGGGGAYAAAGACLGSLGRPSSVTRAPPRRGAAAARFRASSFFARQPGRRTT